MRKISKDYYCEKCNSSKATDEHNGQLVCKACLTDLIRLDNLQKSWMKLFEGRKESRQ